MALSAQLHNPGRYGFGTRRHDALAVVDAVRRRKKNVRSTGI
jgi:hypothetical protein